MVGKVLGECKRREGKGGKSEPGETSTKERVDGGARERKTLKKEKLNRETALEAEVLFDANTAVKREGLKR